MIGESSTLNYRMSLKSVPEIWWMNVEENALSVLTNYTLNMDPTLRLNFLIYENEYNISMFLKIKTIWYQESKCYRQIYEIQIERNNSCLQSWCAAAASAFVNTSAVRCVVGIQWMKNWLMWIAWWIDWYWNIDMFCGADIELDFLQWNVLVVNLSSLAFLCRRHRQRR